MCHRHTLLLRILAGKNTNAETDERGRTGDKDRGGPRCASKRNLSHRFPGRDTEASDVLVPSRVGGVR